MPVNEKQTSDNVIYQRDQYLKGGLGKLNWDYRDRIALSMLDECDKKIVDLGCGEGITLEKVIKLLPASNVIGIDYMCENVSICLKYNLPARQGNLYDLKDLDDNSFDAVLLLEVIEHLKYPDIAIKEIHRILKPKGKLIIAFPNDIFFKIIRIITLKFKEAYYDPGHLKQWTLKEMKQFLNQNDFSIFFSKATPFIFWCISLHGIIGAQKL